MVSAILNWQTPSWIHVFCFGVVRPIWEWWTPCWIGGHYLGGMAGTMVDWWIVFWSGGCHLGLVDSMLDWWVLIWSGGCHLGLADTMLDWWVFFWSGGHYLGLAGMLDWQVLFWNGECHLGMLAPSWCVIYHITSVALSGSHKHTLAMMGTIRINRHCVGLVGSLLVWWVPSCISDHHLELVDIIFGWYASLWFIRPHLGLVGTLSDQHQARRWEHTCPGRTWPLTLWGLSQWSKKRNKYKKKKILNAVKAVK